MSKKDAYQKKLEAQIAEWNAEIEKLKARADEQQADARLAYYEEIESLRERQAKIQQKLTELRNSGQDAWEDIKAGIERSYGEMNKAIESAMSRF